MNILNQVLKTVATNLIESRAQDLIERERGERHKKLREGSIDVEFKIVDDGK